MPRNASGNYTLPSGNPVESGTLIEANWANTTLNDIANELTDSLSRSGEGGMLAPFRLADGLQATPGIAWLNEPSTGFYRAGSNEMWGVVGGTQLLQFTINGMASRFTGGSASTPSITKLGDLNTGIFFPGADEIAVSTGGVSRLSIDAVGGVAIGGTLAVTGGVTANLTGNVTGNVSGNAGTVTNGVYTTGSYANPAWITSLAGSKVSGDISGNAANVTGIVAIANGGTGATTAPAARTALGLAIGTDIPSPGGTGASGTWGISITGNAATVTNGVYTTGSYADPSWLTSVAGSKVTGNISGNAANVTGTVAVANGGTGQTSFADGQLLIGNSTGNTLTKATLTAGSGISITNGSGSITIASTGGGGSVTSVNASGGSTGMSFSGGPITGSGTLTLAGTLDVDNGGTGQTSYTDGQLLIGNSTGNTLTKSTLTAGSGISITNGNGSITIAATGGGGSGSVTSVSGTGNVNGITLTGTVTSAGSLTLGGTLSGVSLSTQVTGTLPIANGGTGATDAATARANLGAGTGNGTVTSVGGTGSVNGLTLSGTVTSSGNLTLGGTLSGVSLTTQVSGTLPIANGGTGATDAATARANLGAGTGNGTVTSVATGTGLSGGPITSTGTISLANTAVAAGAYGSASQVGTFTVDAQGRLTAAGNTAISIANTAVTGLGTMSTQNANAVAITGGSVNGTTIGATTASTGAFTTTTISTSETLSYGTANGVAYLNGSKVLTSGSALVFDGTNLGIGTSSPTARVHAYSGTAMKQLTVDGTGAIKTGINFASGGTTYGQIYFDNTWPYDMSVVQQYTTGSLIFGTNSTERARITSGGLLAFADVTGDKIQLNGTALNAYAISKLAGGGTLGDGEFRFTSGATAAGAFTFSSGASERMRITSAGDVGIGTSSPASKLDVNGTIRDSGGNVRAIPQSGSDKTSSYTLATTDVGRFVGVGSGGSITIPNSTFATGDVVSIFNNTAAGITITCSTTTTYIAGSNTSRASVTLDTRGVATILFISGTVAVINGNVTA